MRRSPFFRTPRMGLALPGLLSTILMLTSCTATSRLHGAHVPEGSLRLGEVMQIAPREAILRNDLMYETLVTSGISESEIRDGSVVVARVFCCGGPNEKGTAIWFYVPSSINIEVGDIAEIWSGKEVKEGESLAGATPNTATRVREKRSSPDKKCRWVPEREYLWARVLYCDGIEEEGWVQQGGLYPVWIKPIAASTPPI